MQKGKICTLPCSCLWLPTLPSSPERHKWFSCSAQENTSDKTATCAACFAGVTFLVCYVLIPTCSRTMRSSSASSRSFVSFTTTVWVPGISCPLGVSGRRCSCAKFASTVRRKSSDWKRGLRKPLGPWPPHLVLGTHSALLACRRHYPGRWDGICPLERFHSLRPSLDSWRVGSCINDFGACSAFTYVTACTLPKSPSDSLHQRLQQSRCLTAALIATGGPNRFPGWYTPAVDDRPSLRTRARR